MLKAKFWAMEESSFAVLRALAMLGGLVALFLVPLRPEHQHHLAPLAWAFVAYKVLLFLAIWFWPDRLRPILLTTTVLDLLFVSLFIWFSGGLESPFYLLFYLLVALAAVQSGPRAGVMTAAAASVLYALASEGGSFHLGWSHLAARMATFFLLGGSLGYLSRQERAARAQAEHLNEELTQNQVRLETAYTDLQAAQARLVQSERLAAIGQMSAKVSHEVRNPLSSISLNAELLEDELGAMSDERRAEAARLVAAIRSQVDILNTVTEEYLRFARLPKPKLELAPLAAVIQDLADFVREELRVRRVRLLVDVREGLPGLRIDPGQIRQALLNLTRNAAEAMPGGGTISLTACVTTQASGAGLELPGPTPPREVEISVTDTGVGIPAEDMDRIFEPFFTSKEGGTGLGLAISRQIAADHGGTLACESIPGRGTTFRLTLPVPDEGHSR